MKFIKTKFSGVFVVKLEKNEDKRGFLARWWEKEEFLKHGVDLEMVQGYISYTKKKGTIRGLHYMVPSSLEIKLTKVLKGSIYEVLVDLRRDSPTFKKWHGFRIKESDFRMLLIPRNFAHAILTLEDNTEFITLYSPEYDSKNEKGIRFNDPQFKFRWPINVKHVSDKDLSWPDFKD